jgi:hypothetical protein
MVPNQPKSKALPPPHTYEISHLHPLPALYTPLHTHV